MCVCYQASYCVHHLHFKFGAILGVFMATFAMYGFTLKCFIHKLRHRLLTIAVVPNELAINRSKINWTKFNSVCVCSAIYCIMVSFLAFLVSRLSWQI